MAIATDIIARSMAAGAIKVSATHIFANDTERDAYFAVNPTELKDGIYVFSGDKIQRREADTWKDVTAAIKGATGATGRDALINGYNIIDIQAGDGIKLDQIGNQFIISSTNEGGSGAGEAFTNLNPTRIDVGGIKAGDTFDNQTLSDMMTRLLYPELFPTLVNPSMTFSRSITGLFEVGIPTTFNLTAVFSRGSINPSYGTNGSRSGLPNKYIYTGEQLPSEVPKTGSTDTHTINNLLFTVPGVKTWTARVTYDAGEQPKTSEGNNYDFPLGAGTTATSSVSIQGVYPFYATTVNITTLTKQALSNGAYFAVTMVAETDFDKQIIDIANVYNYTGVQFYNDATRQWEWIGGRQAVSLNEFVETATNRTIGTEIVGYKTLTHTGTKTGSRELRFYIEEA